MLSRLSLLVLVACGTEPTSISVQLAPDLVSSIDGTLTVQTIAFADREPIPDETIQIVVDYTDRHGGARTIAPVEGQTDKGGAFDTTVTGLAFDGTGTVTAQIAGTTIAASATFAVLDRTPPVVMITPPSANQVRIGSDVSVEVIVSDEIGVSEVSFEAGDGLKRDRGEVVASGAVATKVSFDFQVPDNTAAGSTITLYALAADLSGNQAAAEPVTVTVQP